MKSFRTYQLAKELCQSCQGLKVGIVVRDQLERAALSIVLNLAEGSAKPTERDRKKFYFTALGSLREVQAILEIYGHEAQSATADQLGAHLYRLCHSNGR
ncbi:MAG: four helix bundle protein [Bdellovibrionales bacterium]|nr:four helix bundle protein [Bdellovibrionales bacterium]